MSDTTREPIDGIKGLGGKEGVVKHIEEPITVTGNADKAHFDALMEQKKPEKAVTAGSQNSASTIEEASKPQRTVDPSLQHTSEEIRSSIQKTVSNIATIKEDLNTPNLNIKPYQKLMRSKLRHVDEQLRIAFSKMGREFPGQTEGLEAASPAGQRFNPIEEFVGRLSHIEYQMEDIGNYLDYMGKSKEEFSPANMLAVQMKVYHIGQEVEFFAALLNKALEGFKTILNVQV